MVAEPMDELQILLNSSVSGMQVWYESNALIPEGATTRFLEDQTWFAATAFVAAVDPLIQRYVRIIEGVWPTKAPPVEELLHAGLGRVFLSGWVGSGSSAEAGVAIGLAAEVRRWLSDLKASGCLPPDLSIREIHPRPSGANLLIGGQAVTYVLLAALDQYIVEHRNESYRTTLGYVRTRLGLNGAELARLLGVSREAVRQWEHGAAIAPDRWSTIDKAFSTLQRLTAFIKPEALPSVMRRRVAALNNLSPLEWLLSQRHDELLAFYERLFSYASTE